MWFPTSKNATLNALLIPVRLVVMIVWDVRCQWLGRHKWETVRRRNWNYLSPVYREYDQCVNPWCHALRLDKPERLVRLREGEE